MDTVYCIGTGDITVLHLPKKALTELKSPWHELHTTTHMHAELHAENCTSLCSSINGRQLHRGTPLVHLRKFKNKSNPVSFDSRVVSITNGTWHRENEGAVQGSSPSHVMSPRGGTVGRSSTLWQPHLEPPPLRLMLSTFHCSSSFSSFLKTIQVDVFGRPLWSIGFAVTFGWCWALYE